MGNQNQLECVDQMGVLRPEVLFCSNDGSRCGMQKLGRDMYAVLVLVWYTCTGWEHLVRQHNKYLAVKLASTRALLDL